MKIPVLISLLIVALAGCAASDGDTGDAITPDRSHQDAPFDAISVENDRLFWNGVGVDQSLDRIESVVNRSLEMRREVETPVCGKTHADLVVAGRELTVQLSQRNGGYVSDSVFVPFLFEEKSMSARQLSETVQRAMPRLVPREGLHGPMEGPPLLFVLEDNRDMAIHIKPGRGFHLSRWECMD